VGFRDDGSLEPDLVLHCGDHDVVAAVRSTCQQVGVDAITEAAAQSVVVIRASWRRLAIAAAVAGAVVQRRSAFVGIRSGNRFTASAAPYQM
jgi:hypothetical protein